MYYALNKLQMFIYKNAFCTISTTNLRKTLNCSSFGKPYFILVSLLTSVGQVSTTHLVQT